MLNKKLRVCLGVVLMTTALSACSDEPNINKDGIQNNLHSITDGQNTNNQSNVENKDKNTTELSDNESEHESSEVNIQLNNFKKEIGDTMYNFEQEVVELKNPGSIYALVNKKNALPSDYIPSDLVIPDIRFSFDGNDEKKNLRKVAADAIQLLFDGADEEGIHLFGVSGYRSYKRQETLFTNYSNNHGEEEANKFSARPGQSEHQTGLTMDVSSQSAGFRLTEKFGETEEGIWLKENAHKYGFIIRYPKDKTEITGYNYEPWHIRYVGVELATYIFEEDLTFEEFYQRLK